MFTSALKKVLHHFKKHVGVGVICAVGYFDPGNWSVDIQAGVSFGYRPMLFVILLAGMMAIVLQVLAARLGCVTGLDLAHHCRLLLHDHPKHPRLVRRFVLYPLYALCEIAIISTDLAELLGSAIGLTLLFPNLSLWCAVLLTGIDVFIFLIIGDPSRTGRPVRLFEVVIIILVCAKTVHKPLVAKWNLGFNSFHMFHYATRQGSPRLAANRFGLCAIRGSSSDSAQRNIYSHWNYWRYGHAPCAVSRLESRNPGSSLTTTPTTSSTCRHKTVVIFTKTPTGLDQYFLHLTTQRH